MTVVAFLEKYYSQEEQTELVNILNDLCIYKAVEISLRDFYKTAALKNKILIISQLVLTTSEFSMTIFKRISEIEPGQQKDTTGQKIIDLAFQLIGETYRVSGLDYKEYFDVFFYTIVKIFTIRSYNYLIFIQFINLTKINKKIPVNVETENKSVITLSKTIKLDWQGEKQLDFFIDDLTKFFIGIKTKKKVYLLFDGTQIDFKIILPSKYLLSFLIVFKELHEYRVIKMIGNRGLYVYLKQHLCSPPGDKYPNRDFRKLAHEVKHNEKIKSDIARTTKPLLDKYCNKI